jgi:hypothetical protein
MKNFYKKPSCYTTLPNSFAQDDRLSIEARGLGLLIFSLPENWNFQQTYFYNKAGGDGLNRRKTVVKALNELIKHNYLFRGQERGERGKFADAIWMFDPEGGAKEALRSVLATVGTTSTHGATSTVGTESACPQSAGPLGATIKEIEKKEIEKKETSSSSSTPPETEIEDEDEGVISSEIVPSVSLPPQLSHLTEDVVFDWAKAAAEKPGVNNPARYRAALLKKVREADPETLENVLIFAESGGQKPATKVSARQIGQIAGEIAARIEIMRNHNRSQFEIDKEVEGIMRHAISVHQISQNDVFKIQNDVDILLGGVA